MSVYDELLRTYDPPFPRLRLDGAFDTDVIRQGKGLRAASSPPARSEREEVVEDEEHYEEEEKGEGEEEERKTPAASPSPRADMSPRVPNPVVSTPQSRTGTRMEKVATRTEVVYVEEREEVMTIRQGGGPTEGGEQQGPDSVPNDLPPVSPGGAPLPMAIDEGLGGGGGGGQQGQDQQMTLGEEERVETCKIM